MLCILRLEACILKIGQTGMQTTWWMRIIIPLTRRPQSINIMECRSSTLGGLKVCRLRFQLCFCQVEAHDRVGWTKIFLVQSLPKAHSLPCLNLKLFLATTTTLWSAWGRIFLWEGRMARLLFTLFTRKLIRGVPPNSRRKMTLLGLTWISIRCLKERSKGSKCPKLSPWAMQALQWQLLEWIRKL